MIVNTTPTAAATSGCNILQQYTAKQIDRRHPMQ